MKPDDIPQDVWEQAEMLVISVDGVPTDGGIYNVARALLEAHQRGRREGTEEAATLLHDHATVSNGEFLDPAVPDILAAIRAKAEETAT